MRINWFVGRVILAIITFVLATITSSAHAQHLNWSFANHPQPTSAELTKDEITAIEKVEAGSTRSESDKYCTEVPQAYFQIYNDRYPAFNEIDNEAARYLA